MTAYHNGKKVQVDLANAVKRWPTPREQSSTGPSETATRQGGQDLQTAALWATPAAQDAKNATLPASQEERDTLPGDLLREKVSGQLNPDWVSCLMGYPPDWLHNDGPLDVVPSSTTGSRHASRAR